MLEKLINRIKGKTAQNGKCVWKSIYNHVAKNDIQLESFEDLYQRRAKDCKNCNGYESKRSCFYLKK